MSERTKSALKAAQNMIERYGDKALAEVDLRISELGSREQLEAQNFWSEIREIVRFLLEDGSDESRH